MLDHTLFYGTCSSFALRYHNDRITGLHQNLLELAEGMLRKPTEQSLKPFAGFVYCER